MSERIVQADGVELCSESFGVPGDPPLLLIAGAASSMLHWPEELCERLAAGRRLVIRYDHRDTGRSTAYPPGAPGYTESDLADDALAVLDAHDVRAAHLAGISMGGGIAQLLAVHHPDRVRSLTLIATGPIGTDEAGAAGEQEQESHGATSDESSGPDWAHRDAAIEYLFGLEMSCTSKSRPVPEEFIRDLVTRTVDRARSIASVENHFLLEAERTPRSRLAEVQVPTLIVHGDEDPYFPLPSSAVPLRDAIPGSRLLALERTGHELPPAVWDEVVPAILDHTATGPAG